FAQERSWFRVPLAGSYCDGERTKLRPHVAHRAWSCAAQPVLRRRSRVPIVRAVPVGAWRSPVSALVWGTRGRGFESRRPDQENPLLQYLRVAKGDRFLGFVPPGHAGDMLVFQQQSDCSGGAE